MTRVRGGVSRNVCMTEMGCISEEGDEGDDYKHYYLLRAN